MKKLTLPIVIALLAAYPTAHAEADNSTDLRFCLELPNAQQIAKCAGELKAGSKGKTYSKAEVEKILSETQAKSPAGTSEAITPSPTSEEPKQ